MTGQGFVVWTHRELLEQKPIGREYLLTGDCAGVYRLDDVTERVWTARCDGCGDEIGIPPRQQDSIIAHMRALGGDS